MKKDRQFAKAADGEVSGEAANRTVSRLGLNERSE